MQNEIQGKLNGSPIREPQSGEESIVLFDAFDPPTMAHVRAIEALYQRRQSPILVCPFSGENNEAVRDMCSKRRHAQGQYHQDRQESQ